jgi:hypothetical protein
MFVSFVSLVSGLIVRNDLAVKSDDQGVMIILHCRQGNGYVGCMEYMCTLKDGTYGYVLLDTASEYGGGCLNGNVEHGHRECQYFLTC